MPGALYICRHGEREDWVNSVWQADADFPYDPPLSHDGMRHAQEFGRRMARRVSEAGSGGQIDVIFTSPFWRALQTAGVSNRWIKAPIYVMAELSAHITKKNSEFFETPSLEYNSLPAKLLEFNFPGLKCQGPVTVPKFPETPVMLTERARRAAQFITTEYCLKKNANVLVVTHRQTAARMVQALSGSPRASDTMTGYCALIKLSVSPLTAAWDLQYSHPGEKERHALSYNVKKFLRTTGPTKIMYRGEKGNEARMEQQRRAMGGRHGIPDLAVPIPPMLMSRQDDDETLSGTGSSGTYMGPGYGPRGVPSHTYGPPDDAEGYGYPGGKVAGEGPLIRSSMRGGGGSRAASPRLRGGWAGHPYGPY